MTILALFQRRPVEVLDAWTTGDGRKLAVIRSLDGRRWWAWTHGGWCEDDTCTIPAGTLHPIDECGCVLPEQSCQACKLAALVAYAEVAS